MAARKIKSKRGITIEVWESSFRIGGMAKTISLGRNFQDKALVEFVDAAYEHCFDKASAEAKRKLRGFIDSKLSTLLAD